MQWGFAMAVETGKKLRIPKVFNIAKKIQNLDAISLVLSLSRTLLEI